MIRTKYIANFSNEINKLRKMNSRQKLRYLWDYYKRFLYLLIIIMLATFYTFDVIHQRSSEIILQGFFSNDDYNFFDADTITKDFSEHLGLGPTQRVVFDDSLYVALDSGSDYVVASQGKIAGYIAAKELDFVVTTPELTQHYSSTIPLMDLELFIPKDLLDSISDHIYYLDGVDQIKKAYAIDLSQSRFMKNVNPKGDHPYYLIIPSNASASKELFLFVKYAFNL